MTGLCIVTFSVMALPNPYYKIMKELLQVKR